MEKRGGSLVAVLVVVMVVNCVSGQSIYACFGGCYNQCLLNNGAVQVARLRLPCYYPCLTSCIPRSPVDSSADYHYYCQIGCSLGLCLSVSTDGAATESCFGRCSNLCNV